MRILPPRTQPPTQAITRRHEPAPGPYRTYRSCLRWEFGFTCPFCLLHEADFAAHAEGTGLLQVEHRVPQSEDASQRDEYRNCLLACWQCNRGRSARSLLSPAGARLLDPTVDAWGVHFQAIGDRLEPADGDADASYTHHAYQLDSPAKVRRRKDRREFLMERLDLLRAFLPLRERLLRLVKESRGRESVVALEFLEEKEKEFRRAVRELTRYALEPKDADRACRCAEIANMVLPHELARQAVDVDDISS